VTWRQLDRDERGVLAPLFAGHRPSFLIDAIVEGHLGIATVDDASAPHVAMLAYADILVFGGDPAHPLAAPLAERLPVERAVLPSPPGWPELLAAVHGERLGAIERHAFRDDTLDLDRLRALADAAPTGCDIRRIDLPLARRIVADEAPFLADHVRNFDSPEDFVARGIGFCILGGDAIVAAASSYAICRSGIEIQVNTHPAWQRRGLATVVSARLIVDTLERGLRAPWDAANAASAALAERLGYTPAGGYTVWLRLPEND